MRKNLLLFKKPDSAPAPANIPNLFAGKLTHGQPRQRILIIINALQSGGAERVVTHLLHHLREDFDIHLALFTNKIDYEIPSDIKVFDLAQNIRVNPFTVLLKIPKLSYRLAKYCKEHDIHTSISFLNRPCYTNALMRRLWGFKGKVVMCERTHQSTLLNSNSFLYRVVSKNLVKFSYAQADLVIANSHCSRTDLEENLRVRTPIRVIYNPVDLDSIAHKSKLECAMPGDQDYFTFIAVGGFRKEKNFSMLLESFYILRHLPVKLVIIGGGEQDQLLKRKVKDLALEDQVHFVGWDNNPYKYVIESDCFLLTSNLEGFPNVLLEALACGKTIISTDCKSGPREMLAPATDIYNTNLTHPEIGEYGMLVPVNDVTSMAAAMKHVFEDESLRTEYSRKATLRAKEFDINIVKEYFHVAFGD